MKRLVKRLNINKALNCLVIRLNAYQGAQLLHKAFKLLPRLIIACLSV